MPDVKSLQGKKIVVTGGGRGIGAGISRMAAQYGAQVALTYTSRPETAEKLLAELPGQGHFSVKVDIGNEQEVQTGFEQILERFGSVDGLVNNAGVTNDGLLLRMKPSDFDQVINTNLRGVFLCTKAVLKVMSKSRNGVIVNITSVIGASGNAGQANYAASKAGVVGFSKSVALEMASRNLRVNCVAPGFISTEMTDELSASQKAVILQKIPLQSMGTVEDVGAAVCFLLSDQAKYITGQTIHVNGGLYM